MTLTRRQSEVLEFLRSYISDQRYAPSFEEIAEHFALPTGESHTVPPWEHCSRMDAEL